MNTSPVQVPELCSCSLQPENTQPGEQSGTGCGVPGWDLIPSVTVGSTAVVYISGAPPVDTIAFFECLM